MIRVIRGLITLTLTSLTVTLATPETKDPCTSQQINTPKSPQMVEVDLELIHRGSGEGPLPEWSKVEKLRSFYRSYAAKQATCSIIEGEERAVRLFIARTCLDKEDSGGVPGRLEPETAFQFYGVSRVKVERADKDITREYAFPVAGPAKIAEIAEAGQLNVILEDLAQLQLVTVPRLRRPKIAPENGAEDCFVVSHVTAVPSRVFDEPPVANSSEPSQIHLTLNARRRALEKVAQETKWLERIETEAPGCRVAEAPGFSGRQILSLSLTVRELIPDIDFVTEAVRFWREIEERIEQLRAQDEAWKTEIMEGKPPPQ